jgi:hypothetical protein
MTLPQETRPVFLAQLDVAETNLARARGVLRTVLRPDDHNDRQDRADHRFSAGELESRVESAFDLRLEPLEGRLANLRDKARNRAPLADLWVDLRTYTEQAAGVLDECRSFIEGTLLRRSAVDDGLCGLADALLEELGERTGIGWATPTLLGRADSYASMAGIIRLEFSDSTVWHLPILAHEYGHYLAEEHRRRLLNAVDTTWEFPVLDYISGQSGGGTDNRTANLLQELFADLFAVRALGPAFACTAILLRFNPSAPDSDSDTHPSDPKRAHFIVSALRKANPAYANAARLLERTWADSQRAAQVKPLKSEVVAQLDEWLAGLSEKLDLLRRKSNYSNLPAAVGISRSLTPGGPMFDCSMTDALNAAWLRRAQQPGFGRLGDALEQHIRKLCDHVALLAAQRRRAERQGAKRWRI